MVASLHANLIFACEWVSEEQNATWWLHLRLKLAQTKTNFGEETLMCFVVTKNGLGEDQGRKEKENFLIELCCVDRETGGLMVKKL